MMTKLRQDFEARADEQLRKHEQKITALREELELRRKTEIHEIEEVRLCVVFMWDILCSNPSCAVHPVLSVICGLQRKNGQIQSLMRNHEKAFSDIKNYYNDITLNNLALINSLKVRAYTNTESLVLCVGAEHTYICISSHTYVHFDVCVHC